MQAVESLKICTLIRSFCPKHIKFRWKNTEELCSMTLKSDAKFEEKLTLGSKNDMRNLVNFHSTTQKSRNFTSMGYFCPNFMSFELKEYRGVTFYDTEVMQNDIINWVNCHLSTQSLKNCTMMGSFCQTYLMFQLENFRGIMCHGTEGWCKI